MTSPAEPLGGITLAGGATPPPPPPPGVTADEPVTVTATATAVVTQPPPPGTTTASMPTTAAAAAAATVTLGPPGAIPVFDHVVMVILENHGYTQIMGPAVGGTAGGLANAPYINSQVSASALFTDSHGLGHPSFPNYLALFSGGNQGAVFATGGDKCPPPGSPYSVANLASVLAAAGKTFGGYAESWTGLAVNACGDSLSPQKYAGRHVPWVWFATVPASVHHDFSAFPTTAGGYAALPTVSIVVPDLSHDMHSFGSESDAQTIQAGDTWISTHLDGYAQWAKTHNSLYIIQLDEDNFTTADRIPTMFIGQHVKAGQYSEHITHYNILRTLCDMYGTARPGQAAQVTPITDCWN